MENLLLGPHMGTVVAVESGQYCCSTPWEGERKGLVRARQSLTETGHFPTVLSAPPQGARVGCIPCQEPWQRRGQDPPSFPSDPHSFPASELQAPHPRGSRTGVAAPLSGSAPVCHVLTLAVESVPPY